MKKEKVLLVYKESAYSRYLSSVKSYRKVRDWHYWGTMAQSHQRHHSALKSVREAIKVEKLASDLVLREELYGLRNVDGRYRLIVSVGGDGTLLDASHHAIQTPILGVNSDPHRSVARFSGCDFSTFPRLLRLFLGGRITSRKVQRLEFFVNGKRGNVLVLNDFLITTASPAGTSRYFLKWGHRIEEQMSSGIWVSTAAGSTAAIFSAGGHKLPVLSSRFQFVVREVYQRKFGARRLLRGILGAQEQLEVVSQMKEGRIFVDGANWSVPFRLGDKLQIKVSKYPAFIVGLKH